MKGVYQAMLVFIAAFGMAVPLKVFTQSPPAPQATNKQTIARGEAWFYQRCSLCHMGRILKNENYEPMGPSLRGVLKNGSPDRESAVREQIQRGSLRMPGFRYGFTTEQFEELMAYLKTL